MAEHHLVYDAVQCQINRTTEFRGQHSLKSQAALTVNYAAVLIGIYMCRLHFEMSDIKDKFCKFCGSVDQDICVQVSL